MERRQFSRHQVSVPGKLVATQMARVMDITIRDVSEDGVLVSSTTPQDLPDNVYLWEAAKGTLVECHVRWQQVGKRFGLQFDKSLSPARRRALVEGACGRLPSQKPMLVKQPIGAPAQLSA